MIKVLDFIEAIFSFTMVFLMAAIIFIAILGNESLYVLIRVSAIILVILIAAMPCIKMAKKYYYKKAHIQFLKSELERWEKFKKEVKNEITNDEIKRRDIEIADSQITWIKQQSPA